MSNIAQTINVLQSVILTKDDEMVLTPTYYVFKMYSVHQDATLIPANLKTDKYELDGQSVPAVNASASTKDGVISITLCNLNPNAGENVELSLPGSELSTSNAQILTAKNMNDFNDFGKNESVSLEEFNVPNPKSGKLTFELPAKSVVLVQLK
ncbi:MAG: alpha-N-arabinofuranosidase, partial [Prolixibacteraceae bacterium]|nr:alpha-N-arabinofuranosidase [Prolixibacteraceae bacterium]